MKIFFIKIWKYIAVFFAGIITALVYSIRQFHDQTIIIADTFIASQQQKVGKLKQRGEGNSQNVSMIPKILTRKDKRLARRAAKRELRLTKETQHEEQEQKDY
ncbi:MAG TPA: hypothetical protein DCR40_05195 [Prolixibacteraceae bacterium]|nr:hypothetical protein [Bacteroidota bacterium]HAQ18617.1 hypothetical protein [Prolixibacteraceae bacterium]